MDIYPILNKTKGRFLNILWYHSLLFILMWLCRTDTSLKSQSSSYLLCIILTDIKIVCTYSVPHDVTICLHTMYCPFHNNISVASSIFKFSSWWKPSKPFLQILFKKNRSTLSLSIVRLLDNRTPDNYKQKLISRASSILSLSYSLLILWWSTFHPQLLSLL